MNEKLEYGEESIFICKCREKNNIKYNNFQFLFYELIFIENSIK